MLLRSAAFDPHKMAFPHLDQHRKLGLNQLQVLIRHLDLIEGKPSLLNQPPHLTGGFGLARFYQKMGYPEAL